MVNGGKLRKRLIGSTVLVALPLLAVPAFAQDAPSYVQPHNDSAVAVADTPTSGSFNVPAGRTLPTGANVVFGQVGFDTNVPTQLVINQASNQAIVNFGTFDVAAGYQVNLVQPDANAAMLARVTGTVDSQIAGSITSNGRLVLVNPNGIAFGAGSSVNVGSLVASTLDIADADFLSGQYVFRRTGAARAVSNAGNITANGDVALLGAGVVNEGVVSARLGRVAYGAGDAITLDFGGDGFLQVAVPLSEAEGLTDALGRPLTALVQAGGTTQADGGQIYLSAAAASALLMGAVKVDGDVIANTVRAENGQVHLGSIAVDGGEGLVQLNGNVATDGSNGQNGGTINVHGGAVATGGSISANGANGGTIAIDASRALSLAANTSAQGATGNGGTITYHAGGNITENTAGVTNVSGGRNGGVITAVAGGDYATSGSYGANGLLGLGGRIDITGNSVRLLSTNLQARGLLQGGLVRVGGAFQGGSDGRLSATNFTGFEGRFTGLPTLANAQTTFVNDGVRIDVSSLRGDGGSAIVWSDLQTTMLGALNATGLRHGGYAEVSGKDTLRYVDLGRINTGLGGNLLLDPKDIVIGDAQTVATWQYAAVVGTNLPTNNLHVARLDASDQFGVSVSLNAAGNRMAVGIANDSGATNNLTTGAVRLFTFTDNNFGGGALAAIIGYQYTGGKNVDAGTYLGSGDTFGASVSLNAAGDRLAVGAPGEDGFNNSGNDNGAVFLFTFSDTNFSGGTKVATMGLGYTGGNNVDIGTAVRTGYNFGRSVSLNAVGDRLAVGVPVDYGAANSASGLGAVFLYSFADANFTSGTKMATIGYGYTGGSNLDISSILNGSDNFGYSVSLNAAGDRLAVGAIGDAGASNTIINAGAVRLFSFADSNFGGGNLLATIGHGYTGGNNIDLTANLESADVFGWSVSLNAAGDRLAVGAPGDDGFGNASISNGAVHLFTFADTSFTGGVLAATLGKAYVGGNNVNITVLDSGDSFGASVALNGAGNLLAVGANADDGVGNVTSNSGNVRLFTFANTSFVGANNVRILGSGYEGSNITDIGSAIESGDQFGQAVALNAAGDRLAVGAPFDDGLGNLFTNAGAVHLFTFSNNSFGGGTLVSTIGRGYIGFLNMDLGSALEIGDNFGASVSLNAVGDHLAAGAIGDDSSGNLVSNSGNVRLFTFTNNNFVGGALVATIGHGYTGGDNVPISLDAIDNFGGAVSLNGDGNRLAVGAAGDDGVINANSASGAVRLFTFSTLSFGGGALAATIGRGYTGGKNIDLGTSLDTSDQFGFSVALNAVGDRLAVGAPIDGGLANIRASAGAVRLFTFTDDSFSGGAVAAIIGRGYTGGKNIDLGTDLESTDLLGNSVAISATGNMVAIGAPQDDGRSNVTTNSGAVRLFSFTDTSFSGGTLVTTIGNSYNGADDFNTANISLPTQAGLSLAANGTFTNFAIGFRTPNLVSLFTRQPPTSAGTVTGQTFSYAPTTTQNIVAADIATYLSAGNGLTLQASNDITINSAITVANAGGDGGAFTLQAGRSINVNAAITSDNGNVTFVANDSVANGVVDAQRASGAAAILFGAGGAINAGTGAVSLTLRAGDDKTNFASGNISLGSITAATITVINDGATAGSGIVINSGATLTATGGGESVVLVGDQFTNNGGANAIVASNGGRFLIYTNDWDNDTYGGLAGSHLYNRNYTDNAPASISTTGNVYIHSRQPTLTIGGDALMKSYGNANPTLTYSVTGLVNGDETAAAFTGLPTLSTLVSQFTNVGVYEVTIGQGTAAASSLGYALAFTNGSLDVRPRQITVVARNLSRAYGNSNPTLSYAVGGAGLVNGDVVTGSVTTTADINSNAGSYAITQGTVTSPGSNYAMTFVNGTLTVTPRVLTIVGRNASRIYGDANPALSYVLAGGSLYGSDTLTGNVTTTATNLSNAGTYAITQGTVSAGSNYTIRYTPGVLTVTPRSITIAARSVGRSYGSADPIISYVISGGLGLINGDSFSGALGSTATATSGVGTYNVTLGSLIAGGNGGANYALRLTAGATMTITPRQINVVARNIGRSYGNANPTLTYVVGGAGLANGDTLPGALATSATVTSGIGTYAITQGTLTGGPNYQINSFTGANLTITPRYIVVVARDQSRNEGLDNPVFTYVVGGAGLVNGDTLSGALETFADASAQPGIYSITQGTLSANANYNLGQVINGNLTVVCTVSCAP